MRLPKIQRKAMITLTSDQLREALAKGGLLIGAHTTMKLDTYNALVLEWEEEKYEPIPTREPESGG